MKKCHESRLQSKLKNPDFDAIVTTNYEVAQELPENYLQKLYPKLQSGSISRNFDEIVKSSNTLLQENCLSRNSTSFDMKMSSKGPEARSRKTPGGPVRGDLGHPRRLIIRRSARRVVPEVHQH